MTDSVDRPLLTNATHEDKVASLYELLVSGRIKSLADLQSQLESPVEKTLVKRASLVSTFNQVVFDQALQPSPSDEPVPSNWIGVFSSPTYGPPASQTGG